MPTQAIRGQGLTLTFGGVDIAEMLDVDGPGITQEDIDVTNHASVEGYEESIGGKLVWDPMSFEVNWVPGSAGHVAIRNAIVQRATDSTVVTWPDTISNWGFLGRPMKFMPKAPIEEQLTAEIEIKPTGAATFNE